MGVNRRIVVERNYGDEMTKRDVLIINNRDGTKTEVERPFYAIQLQHTIDERDFLRVEVVTTKMANEKLLIELAAMTAERDSEEAWAEKYAAELAAMTARCEKAEAVCKAFDYQVFNDRDYVSIIPLLADWREAGKP